MEKVDIVSSNLLGDKTSATNEIFAYIKAHGATVVIPEAYKRGCKKAS